MKKLIRTILVITSLTIIISSCKKDKAKFLIGGVWVAENPVKYAYSSGGQNLGVGSTAVQWEILEMDFTQGQDKFPAGYYGTSGSGTMLVNEHDASGNINNYVYDWGFWEYVDGSKSKENKLKNGGGFSDVPAELSEQEKIVGELFNKSGSLRFYVFDIKKNKMTIAFAHLNSFNSGTNNWYYSPLMTFKRK